MIHNEVPDDHFHDECGLMAVWNNSEAANITYLGLYAQQHRGQEGAGIVSYDQAGAGHFFSHRGLGLVSDVFNNFDFGRLPGSRALGHVRYTTAGGHRLSNVQPFFAEVSRGSVAIAHNGNLVNADELRTELIAKGAIFSATSDTEVVLHLIARTKPRTPLVEAVIETLGRLEGAYSFIILFADRLFAVRDPHGFRPLVIGDLQGSPIICSETCALDLVGATYVRDVEPGELIEVTGGGEIASYFPFGRVKPAPCIFEYIYFARPDSHVFGRSVYAVRKRLGQELAREQPVEADVVIPVPDSGVTAAIGYAHEANLPMEMGLIRNHYVGRTFMEPQQGIRDFGVKLKLNPNREVLEGKRVIVVDDSIVRGTTSRKLIALIRQAGAKEVHLRISSPPTIGPCYYGIDTPDRADLIASSKTIPEIAKYIGVDTLGYLSIEGLYRAAQSDRGLMCDACFSDDYPLRIGKSSRRQGRLL